MSERIKQLPDFVANQIAAGEVVNRPASVVKELVENSVDAGSTSVTVNFRNGGKDLIQVVDNGCGMSPVDARLAFCKHATSKITAIDDIYKLGTFGFRGEALPSIASIAEVEMRSRMADSDVGVQVEISGGKFVDQKVVSCPVGTQFMVRNIFYNVPARKRFLDKDTKEANHLIAEFQRIVLCHPHVGFSLFDNDSLLMELPAGPLKQRIVGVVGKSISGKLLEVKTSTSLVRISGFVGRPIAAKKNNKEQFLFVNGRYFKSAYFHKAIISAYEKLIPATEQPSYFIYLEVEPDRIDVNVHPQKIEVKFEDSTAIWQIINAAVRESLAKSGAAPQMDFEMDTSIEIPVLTERRQSAGVGMREPSIKTNPDFNPFESYGKVSVNDFNRSFEGAEPMMARDSGTKNTFEYEQLESDISYEESVLEFIEGADAQQITMELGDVSPNLAVLNFGRRYLVTTLDDMLVVVDINRAYEAIMYDRYMSVVGQGSGATQGLLFAESVCMSIDDYVLLKQCADDFAKVGFEIGFRDEHTVEITGVPAEFASVAVEELLYDMLDGMRDDVSLPEQQRREHLAATMARIGAAALSRRSEAHDSLLVEQLMGCSNPSYTPSGLPTMTSFSQQDIKSRFK